MDVIGIGALARTAVTAIADGVGEALAQKTLINQTARNIGKSAKEFREK